MHTVKELMVPVEEYATVFEEMTVREAIATLANIREKYHSEGKDYRPRTLLVLDRRNRVVGKLQSIEASGGPKPLPIPLPQA